MGDEPRDVLLGALRRYLEAAQADPETWRLVLMPPEGAPEALRAHIEAGRAAAIEALTAAVRPGLLTGVVSPDPELTARTLSAISDEAVRLMLTDPERYPGRARPRARRVAARPPRLTDARRSRAARVP